MKRATLIFMLLLGVMGTYSQAQVEIVKIKNADRSVDVSIANYGEADYTVSVEIEVKGYQVERIVSATFLVPADSTIYLAKLIPVGAPSKYKIRYRAAADDSNTTVPYITAPDVVLYSKNGQKASTEARIYLEKYGIPYIEYNVSYSKDSKREYQAMLDRRGLTDDKVKLPVLVIKGEVYHSISDVSSLLENTL